MPVKIVVQQAVTATTTRLFGLLSRHTLVGLGCVLAVPFLTVPAWGQQAELGLITPSETAEEYLAAIDRIEADYGPYATELSDMFMGLGQTLVSTGDFEQARDAFHRGVMVMRVNSGPNSPEQTNQLYMLADIEALLGNENEADQIMHNVYFINKEFYGENSPELVPVLQRIYDWYQVRKPLGTPFSKYRDYDRNIELTEEMSDISEEVYGETSPEAAEAYRRYAEAEFQMVRHLTGLGMTMTREDYTLATAGSLVPLGLGAESVDEHNNNGRKAYRKYLAALEANPATTPPEMAQALADLGDWYLVFDKSRRARNLYEDAYQVLAQNADYAELAQRFMSEPAPMHFIPRTEPVDPEAAPESVREINLEISMTVTSQGSVRNVEINNAPEEMLEDDLLQIKKQVQETPFRPAMQGGEVVTTKEYLWTYPIIIYGEAS